MRLRAVCSVLIPLAVFVMAGAAPVMAGAPNYDCVAGPHTRVAIDQWRGVVAVEGLSAGRTRWADLRGVHQNGGSLDITFEVAGATWSAAVRGTGTTFTLTRPEGRLTGRCRFVSGVFVLRKTDAGGSVLRATPAGGARRQLLVPVGTAVWETPDQDAAWNAVSVRYPAISRGDWLLVNTYVARAGSLRSFAGWLRQAKPSQP